MLLPSSIGRLKYVSKQQKRVFSCGHHQHNDNDCLQNKNFIDSSGVVKV
jgi:hypothetical protein